MAKKDLTKCRECQDRPIEYRHGTSGSLLVHGICRECYERRVRRGTAGSYHPGSGAGRTQEQKEATHETKYGCDR